MFVNHTTTTGGRAMDRVWERGVTTTVRIRQYLFIYTYHSCGCDHREKTHYCPPFSQLSPFVHYFCPPYVPLAIRPFTEKFVRNGEALKEPGKSPSCIYKLVRLRSILRPLTFSEQIWCPLRPRFLGYLLILVSGYRFNEK